MSGAAEAKRRPNEILRPQIANNILPHWHIGVGVGISNQIHAMLSSAQEDIDAVGCFEKPDFPAFVTPDQGDDDELGFFSLKVVHSSRAEEIVEPLLLQRLFLAVGRSHRRPMG